MINFFDYYFDSAEPIEIHDEGGTRRLVDFSTPRYQKIADFDDFPLRCPSLTTPYISTQR